MKKRRSDIIDRTGEIHKTNDGYEFEIIKYDSARKSVIKFEDGETRENIKYCHIKSGSIRKVKNRIGEIHLTSNGKPMKIIEWFGCKNCTIQFDNGHVIKNLPFSAVERGEVRDPFHRSVHGVGYIGIGKYVKKEKGASKNTPFINIWF